MDVDWSSIKAGRNAVRGIFPRVLKLPIIPDAKEKLYELIPEGASILDVGAHDRNIETFLKKKQKKLTYKSFDVDRTLKHDYYEFDDIKEKFDIAVSFEVIEHIGPRDAVGLITNMHSALKPGGTAVLSTPNVFHPTIFWRDCTHMTGYRYNELAGMMHSVGFINLKAYRVARVSFKDKVVIFLYGPLLKLLNMDFAGRILVTGDKK